MASLNVAEWTPEQVAEWLSGLGESVEQYAAGLAARGVDGAKLLSLRCDDLDYLGVRLIGHQELLLEAVEHLRNFHYECRRECVQQLAVRVSGAGAGLARALRHEALETQTLADVARLVRAIKPLVCWLDRWPLCSSPQLAERKAQLLKLSLEAATCAQRDRFAEQPARSVAASAAAAAAAADYIIQDVSDPGILAPASVEAAALRQGARALGFSVRRAAAGHLQLAHIRFGSPAHASGAVHDGDEILQVGSRCVVGWSGPAVMALCAAAARGAGELALRLRRRGARPPPPPRLPPPPPDPPSDSDGEPLSPPASPTHAHPHHTRMYPPKPRACPPRRHTISCGSPVARRPARAIEQFWRELKEQKWIRGGGSANMSPEPEDSPLYRRDKAVSCSTGLELSPRPRTCLGVALPPAAPAPAPAAAAPPSPCARGKLDKSHSTPAYDLGAPEEGPPGPPGPLAAQTIPESPTTPADSPTVLVHDAEKADRILDFKKSSSQIGEAILRGRHEVDPAEALNAALIDRLEPSPAQQPSAPCAAYNPFFDGVGGSPRPPPPPPRARPPSPAPSPAPPPAPLTPCRDFPTLRIVPRQPETPDKKEHGRGRLDGGRALSKLDILVVGGERRQLPALNMAPDPPPHQQVHPVSISSGTGRGIFPSAKTRSLKKKNSLLAKRRCVAWRTLCGRGGAAGAGGGAAGGAGAAAGAVWQRVRARGAAGGRWARRHLLLAHNLLYAYRSPECTRAACMISLAGFTAAAAGEVKSRPHAFKVYHTGTAFYFAADSRDHMLAWLHLLTRATAAPATPAHGGDAHPPTFSETEYSDTESDSEHPERREREREREKDREKDKSKFGSLKKLTSRMTRCESSEAVAHASLDRKYLRFFSRHRAKDDHKTKSKSGGVPVPTEHYRSYRRPAGAGAGAAGAPSPAGAGPPAAAPRPAPAASIPNLSALSAPEWPRPRAPPPPRTKPDHFLGFVTLEEFMLKKQEEERKQMYSNRVLMGVERPAPGAAGPGAGAADRRAARALHRQLERIVPDVIYGELPAAPAAPAPGPARALPAAPVQTAPVRAPPTGPKPISVKGKDGYEKIVYPEELSGSVPSSPALTPERWRDSLRRNDKVHSGSAGLKLAVPVSTPTTPADSWSPGGGVSRLRLMFGARPNGQEPSDGTAPGVWGRGAGAGAAEAYPHLQCPPTFQPETYCLASLQPAPAPAAAPAPPPRSPPPRP